MVEENVFAVPHPFDKIILPPLEKSLRYHLQKSLQGTLLLQGYP